MAGIAVFLSKIARMNFQQLKLIGIGHLSPDPRWHLNSHDHSIHEMIVVMAGILHVEIGGKQVAADSGSVLLYPAGMSHKEWSDSQNPFETYYISFKGFAPPPPEFRVKRDVCHHIRQLASWLYSNRLSGVLCKEQNQLLLQLILQEFYVPDQNADHNLVTITRNVILNHIDKPFSLEQLAKQAGLSKYHFIRKFKRLTGRTPLAEVRALRADYAKDLILTTDLPLKEIAAKTGLGDEYAFSRLFSTHFGLPPGMFRKTCNNLLRNKAISSGPKKYY